MKKISIKILSKAFLFMSMFTNNVQGQDLIPYQASAFNILWGLKNADSKIIIKACSSKEIHFNNGYAIIKKTGSEWRDELIDINGKELGLFSDKAILNANNAYVWNYLTKEKKVEVFSKKNKSFFTMPYVTVTNTENVFISSTNYKYQLVNEKGVAITNETYNAVIERADGNFTVRKEKLGVVDSKGKVLLEPLLYDYIGEEKNGFSIVKMQNLYGVVDAGYKAVTTCTYDNVSLFKEGVFALKYNGEWMLRTSNEKIIKPEKPAGYFIDGGKDFYVYNVKNDGDYFVYKGAVINAPGQKIVYTKDAKNYIYTKDAILHFVINGKDKILDESPVYYVYLKGEKYLLLREKTGSIQRNFAVYDVQMNKLITASDKADLNYDATYNLFYESPEKKVARDNNIKTYFNSRFQKVW